MMGTPEQEARMTATQMIRRALEYSRRQPTRERLEAIKRSEAAAAALEAAFHIDRLKPLALREPSENLD